MSMRKDWQAAKKESEANFKKAYDEWIKDQQKKAKVGDSKAKQVVLKEVLNQLNDEFGQEYAKPMSFNADLGPTLDSIEKSHAKAESARAAITIDDMLKNKAVKNLWKAWSEKVASVPENYHFLTTGFKLSPQDIYDTYIKNGSEYWLNIDSTAREQWDACAETGDWKAAKKLIAEAVSAIYALTKQDSVEKFKAHAVMARFLRSELGGKDVPKLIEKARDASMQYARQAQAYGKRWKCQKHDFWTPINKALNEILGKLDELSKLYP